MKMLILSVWFFGFVMMNLKFLFYFGLSLLCFMVVFLDGSLLFDILSFMYGLDLFSSFFFCSFWVFMIFMSSILMGFFDVLGMWKLFIYFMLDMGFYVYIKNSSGIKKLFWGIYYSYF